MKVVTFIGITYLRLYKFIIINILYAKENVQKFKTITLPKCRILCFK